MPNPVITAGTSGSITLDATASPAATHAWEIWSANGATLLAHSSAPNGWTVSGSGNARTVTPPASFGAATNLELRVQSGDVAIPVETTGEAH